MPILGVIASSISGNLYSASYDSIATVSGNGSTASLTFSSIPSTYTHLQIRGIARSTFGDSGVDCNMRINGDTGSNYSMHRLTGDGSSALVASSTSADRINRVVHIPAATNAANIFGVGVIDILDYANTNKYKTVRSLHGFNTNTPADVYSNNVALTSGLWQNTTAVNSITLYIAQGNFTTYTSFALYGIKVA